MGHIGGCVMKVLDPLVYCQMKFVDRENSVTECGFFGAERVRGMAFCEKCAERFRSALDDEGAEFVPDLFEPLAPRAQKRGA